MTSLSKLKITDANVDTTDQDSLGGSFILESDIYPMNIDLAYMGQSSGGAVSLNLVFSNGQQSLKQQLWVLSGDAKGNKPTYTDSNGKEVPLPDWLKANALCQLALGKDLGDLDTSPKTIQLWNFDQEKEVDTEVEMLMDLIDQPVVLGVLKTTVDRNVKDNNGKYVPSGETRDENEVDKVFDKDGLTLTEKRAGASDPEFMNRWQKRWAGKVKNKAKGAAAGATTGTGSPAPKKSLFNKPAAA